MTAQRVQRKRTKGWRMPAGAVYVGRGSKWGNPHKVGGEHVGVDWMRTPFISTPVLAYHSVTITPQVARNLYEDDTVNEVVGVPTLDEIREQLAGKDLACWCPTDQHCHGDWLLEVANPDQTPVRHPR